MQRYRAGVTRLVTNKMEKTFGSHKKSVHYGTIPFLFARGLGASPCMLMACECTPGKLYVTADFIDSEQAPDSVGNYKLVVVYLDFCRLCHPALPESTAR